MLTEPRRDVTWIFYDNEEVEADRNGLNLLAASHPEHLDAFEVTASPEPQAADPEVLRARLLQSVRADPKSSRPVAGLSGPEGYEALRTEYRRGLVELAV